MENNTSVSAQYPGFTSTFIVGGRFKLMWKIGAGSFGMIYLAINLANGDKVAVKLESRNTVLPQLLSECRLYNVLQGGIGVPRIWWYGQEKQYNALVMDLLGPSLEDLFNFCSRKLSMKTILMIADQMISRIEHVHNNNFIHRDIKPGNIVLGIGQDSDKLYLIDFGLAKKYRSSRTNEHIPYRGDKKFTGTVVYASINTHLGIEQSRRDDLETLGYVLVYLNRACLPWHQVIGSTWEEKQYKVCEMKISTPLEVLCEGFPQEFADYFNYCRGLGFEETPDYVYLKSLFRSLFQNLHYEYDCIFDWMTQNHRVEDQSGYSGRQGYWDPVSPRDPNRE